MKLQHKIFYIPIMFGSFILFLGNSGNPPDGNTGAPFDGLCTNCHSGGSFDGVVDITGFPSSIIPNTTYSITITATATMGSPPIGGFQLVAVNASNQNSGNLNNTSGQTGTSMFNSREYIDHRGAKSYSGNSVSWSFEWVSPSGPNGSVITMYYASNMANASGNTSGDKIINASKSGTMSGGGVPLSVNIIAKKNVSCNGGNDGEATASAGGGDPPYTYNWSNGQTGNKATMLTAGSYRVTATDFAGSTSTASTFIIQPPVLVHEFKIVKHVTCPDGKDGSINATASGGTAPYNFVYSSGSPNNLFAGQYTVTVSDANSCTNSSSIVVLEPDSFSITRVVFDNPSCPLDSNGQIGINVTGATPPYKYLWSSGETSSQISNKKAGPYKVTITDAKNCGEVRGYELKSVDNVAPMLVAKNSKVYLNDSGKSIPKVLDYILQNKDNCDPSPVLFINIDTFRCIHVGKHNYIISSIDVSGNKAMDTIEIELLDTLKPIIHVWNDTIFKRCDIIVPSIVATDNCAITEFRKLSGPEAGTVFLPGKNTITYFAKDAFNNETTDSFTTEIILPIHISIDSIYFNLCKGDTSFTILSLNHDLGLPMYFYFQKDTSKILTDTSFILKTTQIDTLNFFVTEESGCIFEYKEKANYPGLTLKLDSVKFTHQSDPNNPNGKIEVFLVGADSIGWYDVNNNYINNTGTNLVAGEYIVKAYKGPCEFIYGPYEIQFIVSTNDVYELNLNVFPIPFTSEIYIESKNSSALHYVLLNAQGSLITKGIIDYNTIIDASQLNSGIYFLKCVGTKKFRSIRLIKI